MTSLRKRRLITPNTRDNKTIMLQCLNISPPQTSVPSGSPGSLLTRLCSQSSRSFACSLCQTHQLSALRSPTNAPSLWYGIDTHVILILHVHFASLSPQPHGLFLGNPLILAIVTLVAQRGGGCKHEATRENCADEWEAK